MDGLIDQKGRDKFSLGVIIIFFFGLMFVQTLLPSIAPYANFPAEVQVVYYKIQTVVILGIVIGLVQLLLSLQMVIVAEKTGFFTQCAVNGFNILFIIQALLIRKEYSSLPGLAISIVSIFVCMVVYNQHKRILKHVESLHKFAFIDDLTGLPNRKERVAKIDSMITGPAKLNAFTLLMVDFDNFKVINELLGHQIGDVMLTEIVHNLQNFIKAPDSIGRIGGDEFLIILPGSKGEAEIEAYAQKINSIINQPFYFKDKDYRLTASFGISRYPKDSISASELMQQVDIALFRAKAHGKNQIEFFDEGMQETLEYQLNIERKLSKAVDNKELFIEFQPQYKIPGEKLRGFEVLTRWSSPTMGRIAPSDFIPVAEENGLIVSIGKWILKEACFGFVRLMDDFEEPPTLAVNISVVQFRDPDFLPYVKRIIEESKIPTKYLEFEVTESICINSPDFASHILTELKNLGIRISLDDFGTGYSSLSYLRNLPFDIVKIDKSFIDSIGVIPDDKNIVKSIIEMAHKLDLEVIAEGIEKKEQLEYLEKNGCDYIQGNLLGKPLPMAAL